MILRIVVEVWDGKPQNQLLIERAVQIEAEADILFVPGVSQAAQSVTGKALQDAKKELERRELADYVAGKKGDAQG